MAGDFAAASHKSELKYFKILNTAKLIIFVETRK